MISVRAIVLLLLNVFGVFGDLLCDNIIAVSNSIEANVLAIIQANSSSAASRCGHDLILKASRSPSADVSVEWRETVSEMATASTPNSNSSPVSQARDKADFALIQQELSFRAGPFEKGHYLRRAVAAWDPPDKGAVGDGRCEDGAVAARKNLAYWAEQRGFESEARAVLEEGMRRILFASSREDGKWSNLAYVGLALFNASLCPPHFSSMREVCRRCQDLHRGLDAFLTEGLQHLSTVLRAHSKSNNGKAQHPRQPVPLLSLVGTLPIAWPYLGVCPVKGLHERLSAAYRLSSLLNEAVLATNPSSQSRRGDQEADAVFSNSPDDAAGRGHGEPLESPPLHNPLTAAAQHLAAGEKRRRVGGPSASMQEAGGKRRSRRVRVGIVGEGAGNTSPGVLAFLFLTEGLPRQTFEVVWFELSSLGARPMSFSAAMRARADATIPLSEADSPPLESAGAGTFRRGDALAAARFHVAKADVDVLLYLAIGLTPLTALLAQARLAPVQVVFGHGHPLTTGHRDSVDYFASSHLFEPPESLALSAKSTRLSPTNEEEEEWPWQRWLREREQRGISSRLPSLSSISLSSSGSSSLYSEQLVLFDSLTTSLEAGTVGGCIRNVNGARDSVSAEADSNDVGCAYGGGTRLSRRELLSQLGLPSLFSRRPGPLGGWEEDDNADGQQSGVSPDGEKTSETSDDDWNFDDDMDDPDGAHVHLLLQHSKKLHPSMDTALKRILESDSRAIVLLLDGNRAHLPRWRRTIAGVTNEANNGGVIGGALCIADDYNLTEGEKGCWAGQGDGRSTGSTLSKKPTTSSKLRVLARLRFLPRVEQPFLLALLRVADSFLDPWPWGAGVTSAEAFAACLPVVTLPSATTVLQLSLGQLRQMGLERRVTDTNHCASSDGNGDIGARCCSRDDSVDSHNEHGECTSFELSTRSTASPQEATMSLVASDADHYAALVTRLGTDSVFRTASRKRLCERKGLLLEQNAASDEWASFLERAAVPFMV